MKYKYRISLVLAILIVLLQFVNPATIVFAEDATMVAKITSPQGAYYTGIEFSINAEIDMSDGSNTYENALYEIEFPAKHIKKDSVKPGKLEGASLISNTIVGENYKLVFRVNQIVGGISMSIPILMTFQIYDTPGDYTLPITGKVLSASEEVLKTATPLEIKSLVRTPILEKSIQTHSHVDPTVLDGETVLGGENIYVTFGYSSRFKDDPSGKNGGIVRHRHVKIVDTLPNGAVFDADVNPDWTYDASTNTVSYTKDINVNPTLRTINNVDPNLAMLKLRFPGVSAGQDITNTAKITVSNPALEGNTTVENEDSITFKLTDTPRAYRPSKDPNPRTIYDELESKKQDITWDISLSVNEYSKITNFVFDDDGLDDRLIYTSFEENYANPIFYGPNSEKGTVNIYGYDADNNETLLLENATYPIQKQNIPEEKEIRRIVIKSTEGSYLLRADKNNSFRAIKFTTKLKDPENTHATGDNDSFKNILNLSYSFVEAPTLKVNSPMVESNVKFLGYHPNLKLSGSEIKPSNVVTGEKITFSTTIGTESGIVTGTDVDFQSYMVLMPEGFDYVEGSGKYSPYHNEDFIQYYLDPAGVSNTVDPSRIVINYKDTGKTALFWDFNRPLKIDKNIRENLSLFSVSMEAVARNTALVGENVFEGYYIWKNNGSDSQSSGPQLTGYEGSKDIYDMDNDNNFEEPVVTKSLGVNYVPGKEIILTKASKGNMNTNYVTQGARGEIGTDASYRVKINNLSSSDINNLIILDVFPKQGDTFMVKDNDGNYNPRGSDFSTPLSGPVTHDKFTTYYTTDTYTPSGESPAADFVNNANWTESVSNYEDVTAIKMVLKDGSTILKDTEETITINVKMPVEDTFKNGDKAVNTAAITLNGTDFLEAPPTTLELMAYTIKGNVFSDKNYDGIKDADEVGIASRIIQLLDEFGNPVKNSNGAAIETQTDANGDFVLTTFSEGKYKIKVVKDDSETFSPIKPVNISNGSHVHANGESEFIELNKTVNSAIRNAGLATAELEFIKVWEGDSSVTRPEMELTLYRTTDKAVNGTEVIGAEKKYVNSTTTTAKWENLEVSDSEGNLYYYYVKEAFKEDKPSNANWILGDYDFENNSITNTVVSGNTKKGILEIEKILKNEFENKEAIEFTVVVTDEYGNETTKQIKAEETIVLENLYYGEYTIKETVTHGYKPSYAPEKLEVKADATSAAKFIITNSKDIGENDPNSVDITVTKVWEDNKATSRPAVVIDLYRSVENGQIEKVQNVDAFKPRTSMQSLSEQYTWKNLELTNKDGLQYAYFVKEEYAPGVSSDRYWNMPQGYLKVTNGFVTLTNVYEKPEKPIIDGSLIDFTLTPSITKPKPETESFHKKYVHGYPDGTFQPQGEITRAEVAMIFSRIMQDTMDVRSSTRTHYSDVLENTWYYNAVAYMTENGLMKGYPDGSFKPNAPITRAELAAVSFRYGLQPLITENVKAFSDVNSNHWAYDEITKAQSYGWIKGYPDETFKPDNAITRAETVTLMNRVLSRMADKDYILRNSRELKYYTDVVGHWAYYDICEASNSHYYRYTVKPEEIWNRILVEIY